MTQRTQEEIAESIDRIAETLDKFKSPTSHEQWSAVNDLHRVAEEVRALPCIDPSLEPDFEDRPERMTADDHKQVSGE